MSSLLTLAASVFRYGAEKQTDRHTTTGETHTTATAVDVGNRPEICCCFVVGRPGTSRGLDMTSTTGRRRCCASAADSDEATAALSSRCSLTDHQDVKSQQASSHDSAICYVNPIYSPARHVRPA